MSLPAYPALHQAITTAFQDAPANGIHNASELARAIGSPASTISRHLSGGSFPTPELFGKIVEAFPECQRPLLIRAYMIDALPPHLRHMARPEVRTEKLEENAGDDISIIGELLQRFSPTHQRDLRYLIERALSHPPILTALTHTVNAMRGTL